MTPVDPPVEFATGLPAEIDSLPLPYLEIDTRGHVTRANRAAHALHHPGQGSLIGTLAWDAMAANERKSSLAEFQALAESADEPPVIIRHLFDSTGKFRTYQLHRSWIRDVAGKRVGIRVVGVDVTAATQALEQVRSSLQWLESAIASVTDAIVLTDILGIVRSVNPAAEKLFGFSAAELVGKVIEEAVPLFHYQSADETPLTRRSAIRQHCEGTATLLAQAKKELQVEIRTSPVIDNSSGSVIGVVAILRKRSG